MSKYIFIESRDPSESAEVYQRLALAEELADDGHDVTMFMVQNAVLRTRKGANGDRLISLVDAGITLLADDFSLRERGIATDQLRPGISASPLEAIIDGLCANSRTIWN